MLCLLVQERAGTSCALQPYSGQLQQLCLCVLVWQLCLHRGQEKIFHLGHKNTIVKVDDVTMSVLLAHCARCC
jgi:hypothetical protein